MGNQITVRMKSIAMISADALNIKENLLAEENFETNRNQWEAFSCLSVADGGKKLTW